MTTTHKNVRGLTVRSENVDITELVLLSIAFIHSLNIKSLPFTEWI